MKSRGFVTGLGLAAAMLTSTAALAQDLPSWNDTASRQAIVDFVTAATTEGDEGYVAPEDRIAVFDNDGTLWSEYPTYFQALFIFDRVREMAPDHPEWADEQPFKGVLDGDMAAVAATGEEGLMKLVAVTHAGSTDEEFTAAVTEWFTTARHPDSGRPFTEMTFEPMIEVLEYLRDNGFQTWIVSGGGIDFMRPMTEDVYGIPPQQVVGSQIGKEYQVIDGKPQLVRTPELFFLDDKVGKPVGISRHIGKRPVMAFGNSDGDYEMLEYTTSGDGPSLGVIVHHTDAVREYAYDRDSQAGKLDRALDDAPKNGWVIIDMAADWARVNADPQ
ncbi:HAD family phosphatase [Falsirhodobacter sp. alg1]|uniref:HAD family hydrolase n=1 Tax=Falsirhodobacter sp. alg1 TaxID=1472418 RepID=UPI0009EBEA18|nr:HAD family hydrolase [Falsirhodobacter sp. alg1]